MSNATTVAQARAEFISDLKRLRPNNDAFTAELEDQARKLAEKAQRRRQIVSESAQTYLNSNAAAVQAQVDADLIAHGE